MSKIHNADAFTLMLGGFQIESGRGNDTFVEIATQEDFMTHTAGIDGEGTWSVNKNNYAIVSIHLMQTSSGNQVITAMHNASKLAGGILYPIFGEDRNGTYKIASDECAILKDPDWTIAKEAGVVVWIVGVDRPEIFSGGH